MTDPAIAPAPTGQSYAPTGTPGRPDPDPPIPADRRSPTATPESPHPHPVHPGPAAAVDWAAAHAAVHTISGKWTIPTLAALTDGPRTHTDLHRAIGLGISSKVLTETLTRMQDTGLLTRQPGPATATRPYALTTAGHALLGPLEAIATWHRHNTGPATT